MTNVLYATGCFEIGDVFFDREQNEVIGLAMCGACTRKMLRKYGLSPEEIEAKMEKAYTLK